MAPVLVVPAVAQTRKGVRPQARSFSMALIKASTHRRCEASVATERIFSWGNPRSFADLSIE